MGENLCYKCMFALQATVSEPATAGFLAGAALYLDPFF
jgi:hypothetical protein